MRWIKAFVNQFEFFRIKAKYALIASKQHRYKNMRDIPNYKEIYEEFYGISLEYDIADNKETV